MVIVLQAMENLHKNAKKPKRQRLKHKWVSKLETQIEAYDLLGNVTPNIALTWLLMLSPKCRWVLSSTLGRPRQVEPQLVATMATQVVDMSAYSEGGN